MGNLPKIIQGGMGAGVSDWRLARAVSRTGQLGVVSGVALDQIFARRLQDGDAKALVEPVLLAAELVESARPDRQDFFLTDARVQDLVFMGSKWQAGWALVLGDNRHAEHVKMLQQRDFMVFTDHPGLDKTIFIGDRPTSPV